MKSRLRRYGLMLLLGVTIAIAGCSPAKHYRDYQDVRSLFATLHKQVKSGDSIQRVQELLGPGVQPEDRDKLLRATRRLAERFPEESPVGVKDDDVFLHYTSREDLGVFLQFRKGRLVNFDPQRFEKVPPVRTAPR